MITRQAGATINECANLGDGKAAFINIYDYLHDMNN